MDEENLMETDGARRANASKGANGLSMPVIIGGACAALVLGVLIGRFALGGGAAGGSSALAGKTAVAESQLDTALATYTYGGKTGTVTVRDAILQTSTLESAVDAEGNYTIPAADRALTVARNRIIEEEAVNRGITVTDEDLAAYSTETLGTDDFASIAASYGMDEETVKELLRSSAVMTKLRDSVVEDAGGATAPEAPEAPATKTETVVNEETGEEETTEVEDTAPTKAYADYIIALAGDEWDSTNGTWASPDGPYATALASYEVTPEGATYEAANAAYYVAYQVYSQAQTDVSTQWADFVNGLLSNATITISTLAA